MFLIYNYSLKSSKFIIVSVNIAVNAEPPPKKLKLNDKAKSNIHSNAVSGKIVDTNVSNLHEYRKTMNVVGRGTTHDRINVLFDGLDTDDAPLDEVIIHYSLLRCIAMVCHLCFGVS